MNPGTRNRLTWGVIMAALAAALLLAVDGGSSALGGLTNGAILAATPFGILMVPMCYGLYRTLKMDSEEERRDAQASGGRDPRTEEKPLQGGAGSPHPSTNPGAPPGN